jgi:hypothetical protein
MVPVGPAWTLVGHTQNLSHTLVYCKPLPCGQYLGWPKGSPAHFGAMVVELAISDPLLNDRVRQ